MMLKLTVGLLVLAAAALPVEAQSRSRKKGAEEWNQWRGPNRDNLSPETGLLKEWPSGGPKLVWKATGLGQGYSSVSIGGNLIFTSGDSGGGSKVVAINAEDGKVVWSTRIGEAGEYGGYAGPRSTPATDGKFVYAASQHGDLAALDVAKGTIKWKTSYGDLSKGRPSQWGFADSPLLDGNVLVCVPGGNSTVMGLNKLNGRPVWKTKKIKGNVHYTSLGMAQIGRLKLYLVLTDSAVAGIAPNGQVAFEMNRQGQTAVIPTPAYENGILFVTSGYGVGYTGFAVAGRARKLYSSKDMDCKTGGVVLVKGFVYGFGERSRGFKCINAKTGKVVWQDDSVGGSSGSVAYADGHLIVRSEGGAVGLVEANPRGYKEKGRFNEPDRSGRSTWPPPVIANGKLYLRDQDRLLCYDLKSK